MPTKRKRYMVTETDVVGAALGRVSEALGSHPDIAELVVLGAEEKLRRLEAQQADEEHSRELRRRFVERSRTGRGVDVQALISAREHGWAHE